MPAKASVVPPAYERECPPYFRSLTDLDQWSARPSNTKSKLNGVIDYHPRGIVEGLDSEHRGKLLVCHDYKGGYTETPLAPSYTFNFWQYCETFIYFSHHRVTIPPPGWINAAHRHGVKMLGVLIFEGVEGTQDCLQLLVGKLPRGETGSAAPSSDLRSLPLSPHYARLLAELAHQRGFDGYLLNIEVNLEGGPEQTRLLSAWISLLRHELHRKVGAHAETIWYDSVVYTGHLRWQDRLNSYNLPFFLPSSGFFTNYTWPPHYPSMTAQYFLNLDSTAMPKPKTLQDIYVGVDVWGRGSHGGGGFGCYKAITHIDPKSLGLSTALFGQAWTWESEQDKPGWSWEAWWAYERLLWVGPPRKDDPLPVPPPRQTPLRVGETECSHDPFEPISSFFLRRPPPNPMVHPLFTSFNPGVGRAWFVGGKRVSEFSNGWTDVDKTSSLGDLVWPRPTLQWEGDERAEEPPDAFASLCMEDAWLGGSSLRLSVRFKTSDADDAFFRCAWLPIQSVAITAGKPYDVSVVYKVFSPSGVDVDAGVSLKKLCDAVPEEFRVELTTKPTEELANGWQRLTVQGTLPCAHKADILAAVGLIIGVAVEDPTIATDVSILIGSLNITPGLPSPLVSSFEPRILWVDFSRRDPQVRTTPNMTDMTKALGTVTWGVSAFFTIAAPSRLTAPEDTEPIWSLDPNFPAFAYYNIYMQVHCQDGTLQPLEEATFLGTSGIDGRGDLFYVGDTSILSLPEGVNRIRYIVQGITYQGEVLPWERCAFTSVSLR